MKFLFLFFLVLFSSCATSPGLHRNYIISQSSEEIEEETPAKGP